MIRVNLLPDAGERRGGSEGGQGWLLLVMVVVVMEIIGLVFFHQTKQDELTKIRAEVGQIDSQINDIKALVKDHDKVKGRLKELRAREDAIAKLQSGRSGPTEVLLELSRMLTSGKGPTVLAQAIDEPASGSGKAAAPAEDVAASFNPNWDARRVWITKYAEAERQVRLEGLARDGSDVFEFSQRLKMSKYFEDVELLPGKQREGKDSKIDMVRFALQVKVKY